MATTKDAVIADAMMLSESDRLDVIDRLTESMSAGAAAAWDAEIDRRLDAAEAGRAQFVPWDIARRQIAGDDDASQG